MMEDFNVRINDSIENKLLLLCYNRNDYETDKIREFQMLCRPDYPF